MDSYISNKISVFHSIGFAFVMLHHCGFQNLSYATNIYIECVSGYSLWSICMYFALSGYLFFYGFDKANLFCTIKQKYLHRIRSLLLPLILWSFIGTFLYILLYYWGARDEWTMMAHDIYERGFHVLFLNPGMLQMWFIRDLVICQLFAIPLYYVIYYLRHFAIVLVLLMSYFLGGFYIGWINFSFSSLFYFTIGACFSICKWNIDCRKIPPLVSAILLLLFYFAFVFQAFCPYPNPSYILPLTALFFLSLWMFYDHFPTFFNWLERKFSLRDTYFFMFATFEPLYIITKTKVIDSLGVLFFESSLVQIFILTFLYIAVFYYLNRQALFIRHKLPELYKLIIGQR